MAMLNAFGLGIKAPYLRRGRRGRRSFRGRNDPDTVELLEFAPRLLAAQGAQLEVVVELDREPVFEDACLLADRPARDLDLPTQDAFRPLAAQVDGVVAQCVLRLGQRHADLCRVAAVGQAIKD